ncbi:MAG: diadenylate cyclase CdaA [Clostridia bacterium]|nr:diadenylate cyclase CdaA [Clostridia bacterium]
MREFLNYIVKFFQEYIVETVKTIRITDVLDILILALILYYVYTFIRDRRAGKLALGLILIFGLFFLSSALNMYALKYLFDNFFQVGVIAIMIVFQPEMRAALEKVGGTPFSSLKNITSESGDMATLNAEIDSICSAASDLSREKVGALIVIERTTRLGEYIKSGVIVDSVISPYILRNIFFNKAPLHDGAVIIRDNRVHAAGCFLPMSTNYDIDKDLGTRHRAAIGLTEISDALVIVVSEETGVISLSVNGNLKRNYNYNTLKQELNSILAAQAPIELSKKHHRKEQK